MLIVLAGLDLDPLRRPLDTHSPPAALRAAECGDCHPTQYQYWSTSRHQSAHSNSIYQAGLEAEPQAFCLNCHSPLTEQVAEVLPNLPWYRGQGPYGRPEDTTAVRTPEPLAAEGVTCAVCHLRAGTVLTPTDTTAIHPTRPEPALRSGEACRDCHEFAIPELHDGVTTLSDVLMQSTWTEWQAWGGAATCVDCHMPDGRHLFRGAHDLDWLRQSVLARREGPVVRVQTVDVGHNLPTGDLFRHLTLDTQVGGAWVIRASFGRTFTLVTDASGTHKRLATDTTLRPDVPVDTPVDGPWRLVYHFGSEKDEARGRLPEAELTVTLAAGD